MWLHPQCSTNTCMQRIRARICTYYTHTYMREMEWWASLGYIRKGQRSNYYVLGGLYLGTTSGVKDTMSSRSLQAFLFAFRHVSGPKGHQNGVRIQLKATIRSLMTNLSKTGGRYHQGVRR